MATAKIRTLIVDDSTLTRSILHTALAGHPQIEVVGFAADGLEALNKIAALRPDVVTLDVEMPRLNGIGVLERAAGKVPVSFVMVSSLTRAGTRVTFEALSKGAFDYVAKPETGGPGNAADFSRRLQEKVLGAAEAKGRCELRAAGAGAPTGHRLSAPGAQDWVVAIGISCGGPQTLMQMLPAFPSDFVSMLVTQHMPGQFTASFARHLSDSCSMSVREAEHGSRPEPGTILLAPGGYHLRLVRQDAGLLMHLDRGPKVSGHRPSVDVLFESVAASCGGRSIGIIMTGMGRDGAAGIARMRQAGAWTIAQDEETSLVYGMPKEAVKAGGIDYILPLQKIPEAVAALLRRGVKRTQVTA